MEIGMTVHNNLSVEAKFELELILELNRDAKHLSDINKLNKVS